MTQQPYYPPQYPQAPQQPAYPAQAPQPYAQPAYPQQPFPGVQAPPVQPEVPLANGTLDDFYNQPNGGSGPSISWKGKPDGTTYAGVVARDVTNGDVQQQTDPVTKQPKFYKDGRPMFVMKVPLKFQPTQEHPEGEATLYVRGQMREELVRAMAEAHVKGAPKGGDVIQVTLVQRKPNPQGGNPTNVFAIRYTPGPGHQGTAASSPAAVPEAQPSLQHQHAVPQQVAQPVPQAAQLPPMQHQAAPAPQLVPQAQPEPVAPAQQQAQAPAPQQPAAQPAPPSNLTPEQQALLAQITGQA